MGWKVSEPNKSPVIHIDRRHQSAPKETDADKAVRLAAEEISEGKWTPNKEKLTQLDDMPIALTSGSAKEARRVAEGATYQDFETTRQSLILGEHPRVIEALARLEQEKSTARTSQEYVEKTAMLWELNANSKRSQHWDGEARWQGEENEEMRRGEILSPMEFYKRLMAVVDGGVQWALRDYWVNDKRIRTVGAGRVLLGRNGVRLNDAGAYRVPLLVMATEAVQILRPGENARPDEPMQVATLQFPRATEWMIMRFDEFGVPTTAKHIGWRTALLSMIRQGVITVDEAHKAFPLRSGPAASWYRQQLFEWANHRPEVAQ
jgi:hypothetical protein